MFQVYGYKLVTVGQNNDKYIVTLNKPEKNAILSTFINPQHRKLLIASLTHIFMTGQPVPSGKFMFQNSHYAIHNNIVIV